MNKLTLQKYIEMNLQAMKTCGVKEATFEVHLDSEGFVDSNSLNIVRFTVENKNLLDILNNK